jgi:hypothetical protein
MTLPKGYVPPNKKADDKSKQQADDKSKQQADDKSKQQLVAADDKSKQQADDKSKQQLVAADDKSKQQLVAADDKSKQQLVAADDKSKQQLVAADDKSISKRDNAGLTTPENSYKKFGFENDIDYALLWDEMKKAYMQTVKEATISYFRLVDFWIKDFKK